MILTAYIGQNNTGAPLCANALTGAVISVVRIKL